MKVVALLCAWLSLATTTSAYTLQAQSPMRPVDENEISVPGNNSLYYCSDPSEYGMDIFSIDFKPNPPARGKWLWVVTKANLKQDVTAGATVYLTVKLQAFGRLIQVYSQTIDVCGEDGHGECPMESGNVTLERDVEMPGRIPGGRYAVEIRGVNGEGAGGEELLCVRMMLDL